LPGSTNRLRRTLPNRRALEMTKKPPAAMRAQAAIACHPGAALSCHWDGQEKSLEIQEECLLRKSMMRDYPIHRVECRREEGKE
jgi:hypothetical protein